MRTRIYYNARSLKRKGNGFDQQKLRCCPWPHRCLCLCPCPCLHPGLAWRRNRWGPNSTNSTIGRIIKNQFEEAIFDDYYTFEGQGKDWFLLPVLAKSPHERGDKSLHDTISVAFLVQVHKFDPSPRACATGPFLVCFRGLETGANVSSKIICVGVTIVKSWWLHHWDLDY